jgi:hypothetical protein
VTIRFFSAGAIRASSQETRYPRREVNYIKIKEYEQTTRNNKGRIQRNTPRIPPPEKHETSRTDDHKIRKSLVFIEFQLR